MGFGKRLLSLALIVATLNVAACGYLIYPERVGQRGQHVDGTVVALDALGLLFFILPGVIAFAVDLSTGCIYLPEGKDGGFSLREPAPSGWVPVARVAPYSDEETIAKALKQYVARDRELPTAAGEGRVEWLASVGADGLPQPASAFGGGR